MHAEAREGDGAERCRGVPRLPRHARHPGSKDPESRTYHLNLAATCGRCHGNAEIIRKGRIADGDVVAQFQDSIHGQALSKSGLVVAPNCADCHTRTTSSARPIPASRVFRTTVPDTCGKCHEGMERQYKVGVHGDAPAKGRPDAPVCVDLPLRARDRSGPRAAYWQLQVLRECGTCHAESIRTYRDTFHGQVTQLGFMRVATCADCHGAHDIFPQGRRPVRHVAPAGAWPPAANATRGRTTASRSTTRTRTATTAARNPLLFYAAKFMEALLIGVFAFFGIHTALWFSRSVTHGCATVQAARTPAGVRRSRPWHRPTAGGPPRRYLRFDTFNRVLHGLLMFSFLGLAFTGMPLLFSDAPWAPALAARLRRRALGRPSPPRVRDAADRLLRRCTCSRLLHRLFVQQDLEILWGPASMTPQPRDVVEMIAHIRWFLRLGPRPRFDHFTYWEKFDYWAVFWGMGVIGGSGLVLWFPEFFSRFLPGSWFNIALLVHGEEGLLAVGFIFTIHFFNSHLRPEKFPMDPVIFTGRISRARAAWRSGRPSTSASSARADARGARGRPGAVLGAQRWPRPLPSSP